MEDILRPAMYLFVLGYSCILHECAHVFAAWKLGDPTGKDLGRLTLNPIPHIDPLWTILLPLVTFFAGSFPIGGPKPAPVNPLNFRNPRSGFMITALAGPLTNILLCALGIFLIWALFAFAPEYAGALVTPDVGSPFWEITWNSLLCVNLIFINIFLAAFNLVPVPPLDGSRFLQWILGARGDALIHGIERMGFIPLFFVLWFVSPYVLSPVARGIAIALGGFTDPLFADALVRGYFAR